LRGKGKRGRETKIPLSILYSAITLLRERGSAVILGGKGKGKKEKE